MRRPCTALPADLKEHVVGWLGMNDDEAWPGALGEVIEEAVADAGL